MIIVLSYYIIITNSCYYLRIPLLTILYTQYHINHQSTINHSTKQPKQPNNHIYYIYLINNNKKTTTQSSSSRTYNLLPLLPSFLLVQSVGIGVTSSILPILKPILARDLIAAWAPGPGVLAPIPPCPLILI